MSLNMFLDFMRWLSNFERPTPPRVKPIFILLAWALVMGGLLLGVGAYMKGQEDGGGVSVVYVTVEPKPAQPMPITAKTEPANPAPQTANPNPSEKSGGSFVPQVFRATADFWEELGVDSIFGTVVMIGFLIPAVSTMLKILGGVSERR